DMVKVAGIGGPAGAPTLHLSVDGVDVVVEPGATLLEAAGAAGAFVPTLCHDDRLAPYGSCRVCLVHVDGARGPVASCVTPCADGMRVRTRDPGTVRAARSVLELMVSQLPERALDVPAERSELVRVCEHFGVGANDFGTGYGSARGFDFSHPYVKLDRDLCIACGRCVRMCDQVQGTFALTLASRGYATVVVPGSGGTWANSDCVACGGCVSSCPSGALSEPGFLDLRPVSATTTTTCGYCGVGCTLQVHTGDDAVVAVTPALDGPVNRGHACVKGRFAHGFARHQDRLTTPLLRRGGRGSPLEPVSWGEALGFLADRLGGIRATFGPDAIAMICSSRATNEENYLAQKFLRAGIGTSNIDNCSRLCHAPSAAGLVASFGLSGGTNSMEDMEQADCFLLAGTNTTEAHPVVGARIKQAVLRGAGLVVVDPRRIELADFADVHLHGRPGSNVAVFNGLAHLLVEEGLVDEVFLKERADGWDELRSLLADYPPERVEELSGVPVDDLRRAALLYGRATRPAIVYGLGITEHMHGTDGVRTLANLAILTGHVGTPQSCGVNPLRGQNNVQGASDMGSLPDLLPGYQKVVDDAARGRFEAAWGVRLPAKPGMRIPEMFDAAIAGRLKALYVFGEDIMSTDPDTGHVGAALEACELVVSQEIFLSRTAALADVVLPGASFLEKEGTFCNFDRRFQRVRPALPPLGEARTDFDVLLAVSEALGIDLGVRTPAEAMRECASLAPLYAGISHERLDREGALHWPCRSVDAPGEPTLYLDGFATANGRAQLAAKDYLPPGEEPDAAYPYVLITGRRLEHYNAGTMTLRTPNQDLVPGEWLEMAPDDALRLGVGDGDKVEVISRRGSVVVPARPTRRAASGQVFLSFHFPEAPSNVLTSQAVDTATSCPEYKVTAVQVRTV
ncbi:MAG TPA: formate dehydrogenase subunit alpha, partial [Mycobacteriales bacterium]|nr:formate dehydrogenase subunit alpha [Mycobacteriales bacterium]